MACEAFLNLLFSCSSRTKAFTTRIADTFSCTLSFNLSYFSKEARKYFIAFVATVTSATPRKRTATRYTLANLGLIKKLIAIAKTRLAGALMHIRRSIMYAICTLFTSVVIRVIKLEELNLSILANENVWIFLNIAILKFFANPVAAREPYFAPPTPNPREQSAITTMMIPVTKM